MNTILSIGADREAFIKEFTQLLTKKLTDASERRQHHVNAYVAEWHDSKRTLKQKLMSRVPDECNMSQEARWVMEHLRSQNLEFYVGRCGGVEFRATKWGIFVLVPLVSKDIFLSKWSAETIRDINSARRSKFNSKNVMVCDYSSVRYTWKEWFLGKSPREEVMPTEAQWALEWLRNNQYCYRISRCGVNTTNWGIFVDLENSPKHPS